MACVAFVRVSYRQLTASCGFRDMGAKRVQNKFSLEDSKVMNAVSSGESESDFGKIQKLGHIVSFQKLPSYFLKWWRLTVP